MKEAIGGISLFQIVIVFLLLFTGIMCLTMNHSKAFAVKDEIINILESDEILVSGVNTEDKISEKTVEKIANYLSEAGYRIAGKCPENKEKNKNNWVGYNREGKETNGEAAFCIRAVDVTEAYINDLNNKCKNIKCNYATGGFPNQIYYDVIVFYQLDIPIIKYLTNFRLNGSTKILFG